MPEFKDTGKREFKHPWREAGPLNHLGDGMDPDQLVVNKELSLSEQEGLPVALVNTALNRIVVANEAMRDRCSPPRI